MTGAKLRVAAVRYLNARPLFDGLDREPEPEAAGNGAAARLARVAFDLALPSEVARRVAEDEADVALMPIAAAATIGDLRIVRGCAIGARGKVRSVVLASDRPLEELESVALDLSSKTSVALARLIVRRLRKGKEPRWIGLQAANAIQVDVDSTDDRSPVGMPNEKGWSGVEVDSTVQGRDIVFETGQRELNGTHVDLSCLQIANDLRPAATLRPASVYQKNAQTFNAVECHCGCTKERIRNRAARFWRLLHESPPSSVGSSRQRSPRWPCHKRCPGCRSSQRS